MGGEGGGGSGYHLIVALRQGGSKRDEGQLVFFLKVYVVSRDEYFCWKVLKQYSNILLFK
jgi:hypothetical protein